MDKGHGRLEERRLWTSAELAGYVDFPYVRQVFRIERIVSTLTGLPLRTEVSYGVTSLPPAQASPARLQELIRGHWAIENRVHYVRDRIFDEDRSQVRKHGAPQLMATLRNLAISLLRLAQASNIAAALRHCSRHVRTTLRLIGL